MLTVISDHFNKLKLAYDCLRRLGLNGHLIDSKLLLDCFLLMVKNAMHDKIMIIACLVYIYMYM